MTRDQHLEFCTKCLNRKFDANYGIVCSLTGQVASFEKQCPDFKLDSAVRIHVDDEERLDRDEIKRKLPAEIFEKIRSEQNLTGAIVTGFVAAFVCAILWGIITVVTGFQIGYMALLVGAVVGFAMRISGKGVDPVFGYWGAGISVFGCLLGNFFSIIGFVANENDLGYLETLLRFDYSMLPGIMIDAFDIRDLIFYSLAMATGYKLAIRTVTEKNIKEFKEAN